MIHFLSTLGYIGYFKYLPGTFASLLSGIFFYYVVFSYINFVSYIIIFIVFSIFSVYVCHLANEYVFIEHDSRKIVLDESVGMFISFFPYFFLFYHYAYFILTFILFRFFDIFKPFPINYIDKNYKNGFAIVFDDILAGIFTGIVVYLSLWIQNYL